MTAQAAAAVAIDDDRGLRGPALALTLAGLMVTLFLAVLDSTIVGTALPRIVADLEGFDRYSWVATSYLLASTIMIPIVSKLSDLYGRKRQLVISIIGFVLGSALCGLAQTMDQLILFRFLQGIAGGGLTSLVFAAVADIFSPADRGKWNGLFFGMITLATIAGPPIGGGLTEVLSWRWIFYVNVPLCIIALSVLAIGFKPHRRAVTTRIKDLDYRGGLALMTAIACGLMALIAGEQTFDWLAPLPLGLFAVAVLALGLFIRFERTALEPVISLDLFRGRVVPVGCVIAFILATGVIGSSLYGPLYIQTIIGDSPAVSGLTILPYIVASLVANIATGQFVSRTRRYKPIMRVGCFLMPLGLGAFVWLGPSGDRLAFIACMVIYSIGFSMTAPALNVGLQNAFPPDKMGAGTGVTTLIRSLGQVIGAAVLGSVIIATFNAGLAANIPPSAATLPAAILTELTDPEAFLVRRGPEQGPAVPEDARAAAAEVGTAVQSTLGSSIMAAYVVMLLLTIINVVLIVFFLPDAVLRRGRGSGPPSTGRPVPEPGTGAGHAAAPIG